MLRKNTVTKIDLQILIQELFTTQKLNQKPFLLHFKYNRNLVICIDVQFFKLATCFETYFSSCFTTHICLFALQLFCPNTTENDFLIVYSEAAFSILNHYSGRCIYYPTFIRDVEKAFVFYRLFVKLILD